MASAESQRVVASGGESVGAVRVRSGTRDDMPTIHRLIHDLATYEGVPNGPQLSVQDLILDGFECNPAWFFSLVAETEGGEVVGYAVCNRAYSSWLRRAYYVEDLFVCPQHRHRGVGTRLLARLCQMGVSEGVNRIDWHVLESNAPARAFYSRLGAHCLRETEGRAALRLDICHIQRLAKTDTSPENNAAAAAAADPQ